MRKLTYKHYNLIPLIISIQLISHSFKIIQNIRESPKLLKSKHQNALVPQRDKKKKNNYESIWNIIRVLGF